ncbi:MAG: hypothetical protein ACOY94_00835 [Bacillota bacterium]
MWRTRMTMLLIVSLLLWFPSFSPAQAASGWTDLETSRDVSINKTWVVPLPQGVTWAQVDGAVVHRGDEFVPVLVQLFEGQVVISPVKPYEKNSRYTLRIFLSDGRRLRKEFTTETYPTIQLGTGTVMQISADPKAGFNYDYYLYIPPGLDRSKKAHLLIEPNNTFVSDDPEFHVRRAKEAVAEWGISRQIANRINQPLLVPTFPRPDTPFKGKHVYTHNLSRLALEVGGDLKRIDLQLLAMADDARRLLAHNGIMSSERLLLNGFSASGSFVIKFPILHPERVRAIAGGGVNGLPTLPVASWEGVNLRYPLGVYDLKELTGKPFNPEAYKKVAQFIYQGDQDTNETLYARDIFDPEDTETILKFLPARYYPDRWEKVRSIYQKLGYPIQTHTYRGFDHRWAPIDDLVAFFEANANDGTGLTPITPSSGQ